MYNLPNNIFIKQKFKEYYKSNFVDKIIDVSTREFGIGDFGRKIVKRHLAFSTLNNFNNFLRLNSPLFVSYSLGYYKYPDRRPIENKIWEGADIVYEFDADDLQCACANEHDRWVCKNPDCKKSGKGHIDKCPVCGGPVEKIEYVCDECLGEAKKETLRLINILEFDFKLDPSSFIISFSGSKGYHVRITDDSIKNISKSSRLQLMSYIMGNYLDLKELGFNLDKGRWSCPKPLESKGWNNKILSFISDNIFNLNEKELAKKFEITKGKSKKLIENKELILNKMGNNILWSNFSSANKVWKHIIDKAVSEIKLKIDPASSSDIYKIMRVPDTIHGGTGFLSSYIPNIEKLKEFDPFSDPVILKSENIKKIEILKPVPKFRIFKDIYGPFETGDIKELPECISIFLILKGVAR